MLLTEGVRGVRELMRYGLTHEALTGIIHPDGLRLPGHHPDVPEELHVGSARTGVRHQSHIARHCARGFSHRDTVTGLIERYETLINRRVIVTPIADSLRAVIEAARRNDHRLRADRVGVALIIRSLHADHTAVFREERLGRSAREDRGALLFCPVAQSFNVCRAVLGILVLSDHVPGDAFGRRHLREMEREVMLREPVKIFRRPFKEAAQQRAVRLVMGIAHHAVVCGFHGKRIILITLPAGLNRAKAFRHRGAAAKERVLFKKDRFLAGVHRLSHSRHAGRTAAHHNDIRRHLLLSSACGSRNSDNRGRDRRTGQKMLECHLFLSAISRRRLSGALCSK